MAEASVNGRTFTKADTEHYLRERNNWGRWGDDDELGAINLITPEKRVQAASLVRSGRSVSLSRPFPKEPGAGNPKPAIHYMDRGVRENGGAATDFYGISYHGQQSTHIDALCHVWDENGLYNGRQPDDVITFKGATFGQIDNWRDGLVTRGVLLDVPRFRGTDYVTQDAPVHGWELEQICRSRGIEVTPGDALVVYSGREAWARDNGRPWGTGDVSTAPPGQVHGPDRPGLHASCLEFIREHDVSVLVWDMMDLWPNGVGVPWSVHGAIFAFGIALIDNALLEPVAGVCAELGRDDFMFVTSPLRVEGGTGSPANPLAIL
ncbi:MAG TPA: cyclase family protein [Streptosporangiaceae bacterium]|jgi:kynurenine formamidase